MNNLYLNNLAKEVLRNESEGISKVRFAKIIYFMHKWLVKNEKVAINELNFVRMPLGPVPVGFKQLSKDPQILVTTIPASSNLVYDSQVYELTLVGKAQTQPFLEYSIQEYYKIVNKYNTSQLVEISHKEVSWRNHSNGDEYSIDKQDLENNFSNRSQPVISREVDQQRMQSSLVAGMLDEIVLESTSLEYPKD